MKRLFKFTIVLFLIILLSGCINKKEISSSEFNEFFKEEGFELYDSFDQLVIRDNIKESYIAYNGNYQIELYVLNSIENAKKFYASDVKYYTKENVENDKNHNHESFSTTDDEGKFVYISRIDKTVIYAISDMKYEKDVKNILKKIDY